MNSYYSSKLFHSFDSIASHTLPHFSFIVVRCRSTYANTIEKARKIRNWNNSTAPSCVWLLSGIKITHLMHKMWSINGCDVISRMSSLLNNYASCSTLKFSWASGSIPTCIIIYSFCFIIRGENIIIIIINLLTKKVRWVLADCMKTATNLGQKKMKKRTKNGI